MLKSEYEKIINTKLLNKFKKIFKCDSVRILQPSNKMFLIIGYKKNTKDDIYVWYTQNGRLKNFDYIEEKVIASGHNEKELLISAKEYKRLCNINMLDYLKKTIPGFKIAT